MGARTICVGFRNRTALNLCKLRLSFWLGHAAIAGVYCILILCIFPLINDLQGQNGRVAVSGRSAGRPGAK
jgi:hypothetical protein